VTRNKTQKVTFWGVGSFFLEVEVFYDVVRWLCLPGTSTLPVASCASVGRNEGTRTVVALLVYGEDRKLKFLSSHTLR
jgi:hypothetical protein